MDFYYRKSGIMLSVEFRDVRQKQEFILHLFGVAKKFSGVDLEERSAEVLEMPVRSLIPASTKGMFFKTLKAQKIRLFGCAYAVDLGINDQHIFELKGDRIVNR